MGDAEFLLGESQACGDEVETGVREKNHERIVFLSRLLKQTIRHKQTANATTYKSSETGMRWSQVRNKHSTY